MPRQRAEQDVIGVDVIRGPGAWSRSMSRSGSPSQYRQFYRSVVTPTLRNQFFGQVGASTTWRRDASGGLIHLVTAAAHWTGGARQLSWHVFVPGLDDVMRGDGPALPLGGRVAPGYCHISGTTRELILPETLAAHPEYTEDFEVTGEQSHEEVSRIGERVRATLLLFSRTLEALQSPADALALLVDQDPAAQHRFMPNRSLTPLYAAALAILTHSPRRDELVGALMQPTLGKSFEQNKVWWPVVQRLTSAPT